MRVALVDDDAEIRAVLSEYVHKELSMIGDAAHTLLTFSSGEEFLEAWHPGAFDLIILDILMGGMTGADVARRIRESDGAVRLAFCSSSNEYACESYEVAANYYLTKPITEERVSGMLHRIGLETIEQKRRVALPDGFPVRLRDILYTEYENHVVTVSIKNEPSHTVRTSHGEIEALLSPCSYFFSPYKGILVNLYEVIALGEDSFTLSSGDVLPITRRKYKDAKAAYLKAKLAKAESEGMSE